MTGDNYPSTEAFISDPSGDNLFIGVGQVNAGVGRDTGPFTELAGQNEDNPITTFNLITSTDKNGNFTGIQSRRYFSIQTSLPDKSQRNFLD